jgi:hypothetical protein
MYDVVCVCICMYVIFCFLQHAKGKCLLRPELGTLKSTVKNVPNRNKTPETILGLEHPSPELLVSDLPTVPTAHILQHKYVSIYISIIRTSTYRHILTILSDTYIYIHIHMYTYRYRRICTALKQGWEGSFHAGSGRS